MLWQYPENFIPAEQSLANVSTPVPGVISSARGEETWSRRMMVPRNDAPQPIVPQNTPEYPVWVS